MNMKNERDKALDIVVGGLPLAIELWRRNPEAALPGEAVEILAAWAHLHRFAEPRPKEFASLGSLVGKDAARLCRGAFLHDSPEAWLGALERLTENATGAWPDAEMNACAVTALELFHRLDQVQLASWAMLSLDEEAGLGMARRWVRCGRALYRNIIEFCPIHKYTQRLSAHYAPDLFDDDLRFITEKYYDIVAEAAKVGDRASDPERIAHFAQILPSARRECAANSIRLMLLGRLVTMAQRPKLSAAAKTSTPGQKIVVESFSIKGDGWYATLKLGEDEAVALIRDEESDKKIADGVFFIDTQPATINNGEAVFSFDKLNTALAVSAEVTLERKDRPLSRGTWIMQGQG